MKKFILLTLLCAFGYIIAYAQGTVRGTVNDVDGNPLPGASVIMKGTTTGTVTDINGDYTLNNVPSNATLVYSFVGMEDQEIPVNGRSSISITLQEGTQLEEVVVTALGVSKQEKSLGYSVQKVESDVISKSNTISAIEALSGQAAGLLITSSNGAAGAPSRIVLRGQTSFNGDNEALLVVDGMRVDNAENHTERSLGGVSNSNRGMDIDPNNIESISVLKGGAATALYGIEGARGVILITTKKGKKGEKLSVDFNSSYTFSKVTQMVELQDKYAQGARGNWYGPDGVDPLWWGGFGRALSWGPSLENLYWDGSDYRWDKNGQIVSGNTGSLKKVTPYDNVGDFFQTGFSANHSIALSGGADNVNYRFSISNLSQKGIVPNNDFDRFNATLATNTSLFDEKLDIDGSLSYTKSGGQRIQQGSNISGVMLGLLRTPVTFDNANGLSNPEDDALSYSFEDNTQRNYRGGGGYDNPYWTVNNTPLNDNVHRFLGNFKATYHFNQWLNVSSNVGTDFYVDHRKQVFEIGSRAFPTGQVLEDDYNYRHIDAYFNLLGSGKITSDISVSYNTGINIFDQRNKQVYVQGDGLNFYGFTELGNTVQKSTQVATTKVKTLGLFGTVDFDYKNYLFLSLTGRNDWNSTLIDPFKKFNSSDISFFYPSVSLGFVFTDFLKDMDKASSFTDILTFGKLRVSYAEVGGGAPTAYSTSTTYVPPISAGGTVNDLNDGWTNGITFPFLGTSGYTYNAVAGNSTLKPSRTIDKEIGLDLRFLNNKFGLDISYYTRNSIDQIIAVNIPISTGHQRAIINAGELSTKGFEAVVSVTPIKTDDFKWDFRANFSTWKTLVESLPEGVPNQYLDGFTGTGVYNIAPIDGNKFEYGQLYGQPFQRANSTNASGNPIFDPDEAFNPNGALIIDDSGSPDPNSADYNDNYGYPLADPTQRVIGNPNPDFLLGINNNITYKNWNLSFLVDIKQGGEMWNGTKGALTFFGRTKLTENRDAVIWNSTSGSVHDYANATHVFSGVKASDGSVNDIKAPLDENWYTGNGGGFGSVAEHFIEDASYYRLRVISLSYCFNDLIKSNFFKDITLSFTGRNLWLSTPYTGVDPETSLVGSSSNGQGLDYFQLPGSKSFAFGLSAKF